MGKPVDLAEQALHAFLRHPPPPRAPKCSEKTWHGALDAPRHISYLPCPHVNALPNEGEGGGGLRGALGTNDETGVPEFAANYPPPPPLYKLRP